MNEAKHRIGKFTIFYLKKFTQTCSMSIINLVNFLSFKEMSFKGILLNFYRVNPYVDNKKLKSFKIKLINYS
jgi:hypothetical protein